MKKVLIIESSPRKGGNSNLLCDEFARGAAESGNAVKRIALRDKDIRFCKACYACFKTGRCVQKDDMEEILNEFQAADVVVLASPVYFRAINGQMKTMIDRLLPRWQDLGGHDVYLIITGHDGKGGLSLAVKELEDIFGGMGNRMVGTIWGERVWQKGEVFGTPAMEEAYRSGKDIR
ncbi:MAG: flavodoxin family protein [Acetatifactor muris]|nr:flavodoxin family protein [Acetatifactor muris]